MCFCASMGTAPTGPGYDLALTERTEDGRHMFVVDGAPPRAEILAGVPHAALRGGAGRGWAKPPAVAGAAARSAARCPPPTCPPDPRLT